jgi:hypothetical protein
MEARVQRCVAVGKSAERGRVTEICRSVAQYCPGKTKVVVTRLFSGMVGLKVNEIFECGAEK